MVPVAEATSSTIERAAHLLSAAELVLQESAGMLEGVGKLDPQDPLVRALEERLDALRRWNTELRLVFMSHRPVEPHEDDWPDLSESGL